MLVVVWWGLWWWWVGAATMGTGVGALSSTSGGSHHHHAGPPSLWECLGSSSSSSPAGAWGTVFGAAGDRGEYMDGYSPAAMADRCTNDYSWKPPPNQGLAGQRKRMMSSFYGDERLWEHVSMVAFAEHYVLLPSNDDELKEEEKEEPFRVFLGQKESAARKETPIFAGVVFSGWESHDNEHNHDEHDKLGVFAKKGIDYVRLECNLGTVADLQQKDDHTGVLAYHDRLGKLASVARACQDRGLVPLVLLQVPWRDPGVSSQCFGDAVGAFFAALDREGVAPDRLLFETRPPMGMSAAEERALGAASRVELGFKVGENIFGVIEGVLSGNHGDPTTLAGFCVAGGSTKGDPPTAMEDDTQNAVRQGIRSCARDTWGYDFCFWEMGAKLLLTPGVGRLWGEGRHREATDLFRANAAGLAEEIRSGLPP